MPNKSAKARFASSFPPHSRRMVYVRASRCASVILKGEARVRRVDKIVALLQESVPPQPKLLEKQPPAKRTNVGRFETCRARRWTKFFARFRVYRKFGTRFVFEMKFNFECMTITQLRQNDGLSLRDIPWSFNFSEPRTNLRNFPHDGNFLSPLKITSDILYTS